MAERDRTHGNYTGHTYYYHPIGRKVKYSFFLLWQYYSTTTVMYHYLGTALIFSYQVGETQLKKYMFSFYD